MGNPLNHGIAAGAGALVACIILASWLPPRVVSTESRQFRIEQFSAAPGKENGSVSLYDTQLRRQLNWVPIKARCTSGFKVGATIDLDVDNVQPIGGEQYRIIRTDRICDLKLFSIGPPQ